MKKLAAAFGTVLLLGACATPLDMIDIMAIKDKPTPTAGTAFSRALFAEYQAQTRIESDGLGRWKDAARYAAKGLKAAEGKPPAPELVVKVTPAAPNRCSYMCVSKPEETVDWRVPEERAGELVTARERLIAALDSGARDRAPEAAARAQVMFDCWVEEEVGGRSDSECRSNFLTAESRLGR